MGQAGKSSRKDVVAVTAIVIVVGDWLLLPLLFGATDRAALQAAGAFLSRHNKGD